MSQIKTIHRLSPQTEAPDSLVILLHGYGADGQDLLDLGQHWRAMLPGTLFLAPNAPTACEINPQGFQWWSLSHILQNGIDPTRPDLLRMKGAEAQRQPLIDLIDAERQKLNLPWSKVALVGFSQGTMLALDVGLRLPEAPAAIIGFSGMLLAADELGAPGIVKPPILLIHGMMDMVVPFAATGMAAAALAANGFKVETLPCPQLGHGIDQQGLAAGGAFLQKYLG